LPTTNGTPSGAPTYERILSMTRRLMIAAGVIAPITVALLASPRHSAACTMDPAPYARMPHHSHLVVVPTGRLVSSAGRLPRRFANVRAPRGFEETIWQPGRRWWWEARITRWFGRLRDRPPYGQVARLEYVGARGTSRIGNAHDVVIVRWSTSSTCGPALRLERTPALAAGERLFLTATLRDTAHWISGLPTLDMATEHFSHYDREHWNAPIDRARRRMRARDVLAAYEALPAFDALRYQESAAALAPLRAWARSHPALADQYPAQRMIAKATQFALYSDSARLMLERASPPMPNVHRER
jgi:hypothetical protein